MRVLLTGAAGFIGHKVAEMLAERGDEVLGVDNLNDAYDVKLKEWRLAKLRELSRFRFLRADIVDFKMMKEIFETEKFDAVINLAARAGVRASVKNPWVYVETNTVGTLNLLELSKDHGVKKFVLASTSSIYGLNSPPFSESMVTDTPLSVYAASKKGAEALTFSYHHLYDIDVTVFRYFTVYGPAGRPDMSIFKFIKLIAEGEPIPVFGDGNQERDFTYVDDIARGTIAGLRPLGYEVVNLGNNRPVKLNYVIGLIEEYLGKKAGIEYFPPHPADVPRTMADIGKAHALLGWTPEVPIEEGVRKAVEWYLDNREWARNVNVS